METDSNPGDASNGAKSYFDQIAAYQKIWAESMGKMMQSAVSFSPNASLPDFLRQMRGGIFQGQAKSWDEFLRSPQFLEGMRQWLENSIAIRKMTNDFLTRTHHEMQGTARGDVDAMMLAVRHMEQRILDRLEKIEERLETTPTAKPNGGTRKTKPTPARSRKRPAATAAQTPNSKANV